MCRTYGRDEKHIHTLTGKHYERRTLPYKSGDIKADRKRSTMLQGGLGSCGTDYRPIMGSCANLRVQ